MTIKPFRIRVLQKRTWNVSHLFWSNLERFPPIFDRTWNVYHLFLIYFEGWDQIRSKNLERFPPILKTKEQKMLELLTNLERFPPILIELGTFPTYFLERLPPIWGKLSTTYSKYFLGQIKNRSIDRFELDQLIYLDQFRSILKKIRHKPLCNYYI